MSHMALKVIDEDGDAIMEEEYQNSHGFCMFVWDRLIERYPIPGPRYAFREGEKDVYQNLWDGVQDGTLEIEPWEHNVLLTTYDRVLVSRKYLSLLVTSLRRFVEAHDNGRWVCHLGAIADAIERLVRTDQNVQAICFYQTSTARDLFGGVHLEPCDGERCGQQPCDCEEDRPYNINVDEGHWYAQLYPVEGQ